MRNLMVNMQGADVAALQGALLFNGFNPGPIDGKFGAGTNATVKIFQQRKGLAVDAIAGPQTFEKLGINSTRYLYLNVPNMQGADVAALQGALLYNGFNPGPIDGIFGPGTSQALKNYQVAKGLTADGIAGPQTKTSLSLNSSQAQIIAKDFLNAVKAIFDGFGIPEFVWHPIMQMESGENPNSHLLNSIEDSRGLYQINITANPQYKNINLFDPVENAKIAARDFIAPAFNRGRQLGFWDADLTAFCWKNGIRPYWTEQKNQAIRAATRKYL